MDQPKQSEIATKEWSLNSLLREHCEGKIDKNGNIEENEWIHLERILRPTEENGAEMYFIRGVDQHKVNRCKEIFRASEGWGMLHFCLTIATEDKHKPGEGTVYALDAQHRLKSLRELVTDEQADSRGKVFTNSFRVQCYVLRKGTSPETCRLISRLLNYEGSLSDADNMFDVCYWLRTTVDFRQKESKGVGTDEIWEMLQANKALFTTLERFSTKLALERHIRYVKNLGKEGALVMKSLQAVDQRLLFRNHINHMATNVEVIDGSDSSPTHRLLISVNPKTNRYAAEWTEVSGNSRETECCISRNAYSPVRIGGLRTVTQH